MAKKGKKNRNHLNVIEINGQRYDAKSGVVLSAASASKKAAVKNIDGVVTTSKQRSAARQTVAPAAPKAASSKVAKAAQPARRHAPQPTKTLMRHSVHKPLPKAKSQVKALGPADALGTTDTSSLLAPAPIGPLDSRRLRHAQHVRKSRLISRFGTPEPNAPDVPPAAPVLPPSVRPGTPSKKAKTTADLLEQAVQQANSHQQTAPARKKRSLKRWSTRGALAVASLAVVGFVVTHGLTAARLHLASSKAGFTASLPDYKPVGYHVGELQYSPGVVAIHFDSNSDKRSYTITQKNSNWDSAALRDQFVARQDKHYQVIQSAGQTFYLYGKNNATWVNGGIWYQVQSNGSLSDRQLVELAKSL